MPLNYFEAHVGNTKHLNHLPLDAVKNSARHSKTHMEQQKEGDPNDGCK